PIVDSGRNVILDASFSRKSQRDAVRRWATARGIGAQLLEVRCSKDLAMERLAKRERSGHDPSDAGPSLYRWSVENFQPPTEWPRENVIEIVTDDSEWRDRLAGLQNSRPTP
ncbi:MAG: AAA family ATPase, partial [Deltaproteobacteria bacterium]|nr:AAA family ATPase [Deltaproteobacteria bacterium]